MRYTVSALLAVFVKYIRVIILINYHVAYLLRGVCLDDLIVEETFQELIMCYCAKDVTVTYNWLTSVVRGHDAHIGCIFNNEQ